MTFGYFCDLVLCSEIPSESQKEPAMRVKFIIVTRLNGDYATGEPELNRRVNAFLALASAQDITCVVGEPVIATAGGHGGVVIVVKITTVKEVDESSAPTTK